MGPFVQGLHRRDVKWSKFKPSYMYNSIYYRRRTKFVVYQLATTSVGIGCGLGNSTMRKYSSDIKHPVVGFPHATIDASAIVGSFAFNTFAGVFIGLLFGTAVLFDLFWPERIESATLQWTWKICALLASASQLAASIATTVIVSTMHAAINGVPPGERSAFEQAWTGTPLLYRKNTTAVVCIIFGWIGCVSAVYSTSVMWDFYAHNHKWGPFADRQRAESDPTPTVGMNTSASGMGRVCEDERGGKSPRLSSR